MNTFERHELEKAVLALLGLEGKNVTRLVLTLDADGPPVLELTTTLLPHGLATPE